MQDNNRDSRKREWRWWPHLVLILAAVMVAVIAVIIVMAQTFPVPDDAPMEVPFPDDGENVPGPEWLYLLFWLPFWYFKGRLKKYLFLTSLVPIVLSVLLIALPFFHKLPLERLPGLKGLLGKIRAMRTGMKKSFIYASLPLIFALTIGIGMYKSGHQAKTLGCDSCHSPAMGHRMAVPPADVARYYSVDRARQIGVGKYRAGKSIGVDEGGEQVYESSAGEAEGYKDANWQLRHMYEPTFTW